MQSPIMSDRAATGRRGLHDHHGRRWVGVSAARTARGWSAVSARALDAAGITDPALRAAFEECRKLHAAHGKTYYLATLLLPPAKRPYVWALYGFARYADEFVDSLDRPDPQALLDWGAAFLDGLS